MEKREGNKRPEKGKENLRGEGESAHEEALCAKVNMEVERAAGDAWQCCPFIGNNDKRAKRNTKEKSHSRSRRYIEKRGEERSKEKKALEETRGERRVVREAGVGVRGRGDWEKGEGEEIKCAIFENRRDWLPTAGHVIETNRITMATRRAPGADGQQQQQQQQRAPRFQFFTRRAALPVSSHPILLFPLRLPILSSSGSPVTSCPLPYPLFFHSSRSRVRRSGMEETFLFPFKVPSFSRRSAPKRPSASQVDEEKEGKRGKMGENETRSKNENGLRKLCGASAASANSNKTNKHQQQKRG